MKNGRIAKTKDSRLLGTPTIRQNAAHDAKITNSSLLSIAAVYH